MTRNIKTIPAAKPSPVKPKRVKKAKPASLIIQHCSLGPCSVIGIFLTAGGRIVVDCDFNGVTRTLALDASYWVSDISELLLAMPPQTRSLVKEKPAKAAPDADETEEPELMLNADGHLREDAGESSESEETGEEEVEAEDAELVEV
jgi:hypothetical protein